MKAKQRWFQYGRLHIVGNQRFFESFVPIQICWLPYFCQTQCSEVFRPMFLLSRTLEKVTAVCHLSRNVSPEFLRSRPSTERRLGEMRGRTVGCGHTLHPGAVRWRGETAETLGKRLETNDIRLLPFSRSWRAETLVERPLNSDFGRNKEVKLFGWEHNHQRNIDSKECKVYHAGSINVSLP